MTTRCFVIGHPVAHSRSPLIHGGWLAEHRLDGSYERIDVAPDALAGFVARVRAGDFAGGNVTVPHKQAVLPLLDQIGDAALAIGAVNTLWREGGRLHGDNTDAAGFLAHLEERAPRWRDTVGCALVLGAEQGGRCEAPQPVGDDGGRRGEVPAGKRHHCLQGRWDVDSGRRTAGGSRRHGGGHWRALGPPRRSAP